MSRGRSSHDGRTVVDRALGIVTRVHPGEGGLALLLALDVFLLLTAYYVIKPVREGLILAGSGAEVKSYAAVGQVLLLTLLVPGYSALAGRMKRRSLMRFVFLFFTACLILFYFLAEMRFPALGVIFFLWVGIFSLMVIAQFWSFATDLYTQEQGERLLPVAAFGASVGAVFGSHLTATFVGALGVNPMLLVSAGILLGALGLTEFIDHRFTEKVSSTDVEGVRQERKPHEPDATTEPELGRGGAFRLVLGNPYLRLVAVVMMLANLVNTTGEFILGSVVAETADKLVQSGKSGGLSAREYIGRFYAEFFLWVNVSGVFMQFFLVSRIMRYAGVMRSVMALPAIALLSYFSLAMVPVLGVVRWVKTAENATDYSLNNTVRNALFLPLTREEKYKAKQAIDTFFVRGGDVLSAGLVYLGLNVVALGKSGFAWINVGLVVLWLFFALRVGRRYHTGRTGITDTRQP